MKNIFIFLILFIISYHTNAQEIESLYDGLTYGEANKYYKDVYNDLDAFTGTWTFTDDTTSFTITLQKKVRMQQDNFYEDVLVGGYSYVVDGGVLVNTLPLLNNNYQQKQNYTLFGNSIIGPIYLDCIDCTPSTRRVSVAFWEPNRDVWFMVPKMIFERVDANGVQKLKVVFKTTATASPNSMDHEPEYDTYSIPLGTYTLTKQ